MLPTKNPYNASTTSFDHHIVLFPTRSVGRVPTPSFAQIPVRPADGRPAVQQARIRRLTVREVVVLEVAGRLGDVVDDLDLAIQMALADEPRGVVCDLSAVHEGAEPGAVQMLASAGRHVRDWAGIPVAVACPDPRVRLALAGHPLGGHLIVTASLFSAVSMVLLTPHLPVQRLRLAPHPTAPRGSRNFVTHTLQEWGLAPLIFSAGLVLSELVKSSTMNATIDIDLSIALSPRAIRLTVRDNSPALAHEQYHSWNLHGSKTSAVAALSRSFGTLPTADGGKVAWAVINAAPSQGSLSSQSPDPVPS